VLFGYYYINLLQKLFKPTDGRRFKSISLINLDVDTFQTRISQILDTFKHQLVSLKIEFTRVRCHRTTAQIVQSSEYLLADFTLLKYLLLGDSEEMELIAHINSTIINNTVFSLTISSTEHARSTTILDRFEKLKALRINFYSINKRLNE
jgi:hypothetical protein